MSDNGGLIATPAIDYVPDWALAAAIEWRFDIESTPRFGDFARTNFSTAGSDNSPLPGGKGSLVGGGMRVPSVVYWKRQVAPSKAAQMVAVQDIMPTLLELAGSPVDAKTIDGRSVWSMPSFQSMM